MKLQQLITQKEKAFDKKEWFVKHYYSLEAREDGNFDWFLTNKQDAEDIRSDIKSFLSTAITEAFNAGREEK